MEEKLTKVAVCITVKNEESSIAELLESLLKQTKKPDEIIVVDGGSSDKTHEIIRHYSKKYAFVKLFRKKSNIAEGRNIAIEMARSDVIALTDAGCYALRNWLENLTYPFKYSNVDVVAGFYKMPFKNEAQKIQNLFLGIHPKRFDRESFLPSARSMAFKKTIWEEVGGFDTNLENAGEDSLFNYKLVKHNVKIVRAGEARVVWNDLTKLSYQKFFKKIQNYAKGDAQANIWWHPTKGILSHNIKIISIYLRYFMLLIFAFISINNKTFLVYLFLYVLFYLFWSVWKWKDIKFSLKSRLLFPFYQITSDIAVMSGFLKGIIPNLNAR